MGELNNVANCENCRPMVLIEEFAKSLVRLQEKNDEQGKRIGDNEKALERVDTKVDGLSEMMSKYNEAMLKLVESHTDLREQNGKILDKLASAHHRIDSFEGQTEAIIRMSMSVESLAREVEKHTKNSEEQDTKYSVMFEKLGDRVTGVENQPAKLALKSYQFIFGIIATVVVTAVATAIFAPIVSKYIH